MDFIGLGILNSLVSDYIGRKDNLRTFINEYPDLDGLNKIAEHRSVHSMQKREVLVDALKSQYQHVPNAEKSLAQIEKLKQSNTFTVTTGHQLCLATGPLYMIYKVLHTIKLAEELNKNWKDRHVVPVFWMATEDHDFEEINHVQLFGKKISWESQQKGGVGRFEIAELKPVIEEISAAFGSHQNASEIQEWLTAAYSKLNLAEAMRSLIHQLFGQQGLVIIDGDDSALKGLFSPIISREIFHQETAKCVDESIEGLKDLGYHIQANPREINLFLLDDKGRERIVEDGTDFAGADSGRKFTSDQMKTWIASNPEKFSPNVLMRPMYQECILPNLCYLGGGGEIAYWLQLRSAFENYGLTFPALMVRNSVVLIDGKSSDKMEKLELQAKDLFGDLESYLSHRAAEKANIDFTEQKSKLEEIYSSIKPQAESIDPTLGKSILAEQQRQINALENLEKKLIKAAKNAQELEINQIRKLADKFFPDGSFQERKMNIMEFWLNQGPVIFEEIKEAIDPLNPKVNIIKLT